MFSLHGTTVTKDTFHAQSSGLHHQHGVSLAFKHVGAEHALIHHSTWGLEEKNFKVILDYTGSLRPVWDICLPTQKKRHSKKERHGPDTTGAREWAIQCSTLLLAVTGTMTSDTPWSLSYTHAAPYLPIVWLFPVSGIIQFKTFCLEI